MLDILIDTIVIFTSAYRFHLFCFYCFLFLVFKRSYAYFTKGNIFDPFLSVVPKKRSIIFYFVLFCFDLFVYFSVYFRPCFYFLFGAIQFLYRFVSKQ